MARKVSRKSSKRTSRTSRKSSKRRTAKRTSRKSSKRRTAKRTSRKSSKRRTRTRKSKRSVRKSRRSKRKSVLSTMKFKISKDLQNTLKLPSSVPRTVVTKKVWAHIKSKKLQDPKNRRDIVLDDNLAKLFSKKKGDIVNMFKLQKHLNKHYL